MVWAHCDQAAGFEIWVNVDGDGLSEDIGSSLDVMVNSPPPSDSLGAVLGHTHITIDQLFGIVSTIMREAREAVEAENANPRKVRKKA